MRRMSVDLPEPFAPRIPWMSPRSRRSDTSEIATTGLRLRPTTNRFVTPSISRAAVADRAEPTSCSGTAEASTLCGVIGAPFFSSGVRVGLTGDSRVVVKGRGNGKAAGLLDD
jgi:hypothetical protein